MPYPIHIQSRLAGKHWPETGTPACFRTGYVWPKPDTVSQNQIGSGLVFLNMIRAICG